MKKIVFILTIILFQCAAMNAVAQEQPGRIRALKMDYVIRETKLTADQTAKFKPLYTRYEDELKGIRKGFKEKYQQQNPAANPDMARRYVLDNLEYQQAELNLKKKYKDEFMKVLSAQQLAELYRAEQDFKKMLIQELNDRKAAPAAK
jgi:Spy/CpxP family protein refolding chaperone